MARHGPGGAFYSTDDLIKMARLDQFGVYSPVICRALLKLKQTEDENAKLIETIESYEKMEEIRNNYESSQDDQVNLDDLHESY